MLTSALLVVKSSRNDFAVVADAVPFWNVDNNLKVVKCGEHEVQHGCGEHGGECASGVVGSLPLMLPSWTQLRVRQLAI